MRLLPPPSTFIAIVLLSIPLIAQQRRVEPGQTHERLVAIVPLQGAGTMADPKRPMFAPAGDRRAITQAPLKLSPQSKSAILAYSWHPSDDGKSAIVEFVARDRSAFTEILSSKDARVQTFERSKHGKSEMEAAIKKEKKDFDPTKFGTRMN